MPLPFLLFNNCTAYIYWSYTYFCIRYLQKSINSTSGIRKQDAASVFSAVYSNPDGVATALNFLKNNFSDIADL